MAIGAHGPTAAGSTTLQQIATATGGKYYVVSQPNAQCCRGSIRRRPAASSGRWSSSVTAGFRPQIKISARNDARASRARLPPITGYVLTTPKENPLVEISLVSPVPAGRGEQHDPGQLDLWAGQGRGLYDRRRQALGQRRGPGWENYDKLFSQMVRWSMRPTGEEGKFTVATDVQDGKVQRRRHRAGQERRVLELSEHVGSTRGRPGHEADRPGDQANRAGPLRRRIRRPKTPAAIC